MEYFDLPRASGSAGSTAQQGAGSVVTPSGESSNLGVQGSNRTPVGTPLGHPNSISISTAFNPTLSVDGAAPDLMLVSLDRVHFYVHRSKILAASNNLLAGQLPLDIKPDGTHGLPAVDTPHHSDVLNVVLHTMYGMACLHYFPSLEVVDAALSALALYGTPLQQYARPNQPLYLLLLSFAPYHPIEVYAVAACHGLEDAAVAISSHLLAYDLANLPDGAAQKMGPLYLKRLLVLHQSRIAALRAILFKPPSAHPAAPGCTAETQQQLTRAWAFAVAQIVWDILPNVSTNALKSRLEPIGAKIDCPSCAAMLHQRVQEVEYEWLAVKVSYSIVLRRV
ncbi:hypothetical protein C8Q78DRAFT_626824 [Trametes maxima]|nr:hypothetical protein C8Q78DRAFT_626824 [Trametes maxima]